jgi:uncharacterized protein (DUF2267 family)
MRRRWRARRVSCEKCKLENTMMHMLEFVGRVRSAARLPSMEQAFNATSATLRTLAERLGTDEARHLSAQLPEGIGQFLEGVPPTAVVITRDEFLRRVSRREGVELPVSVCHARAVLDTLQQAIPEVDLYDVLQRLPADYAPLFAGTTGKLRLN